MADQAHDGGGVGAPEPPHPGGTTEPLPPGCMGLVFAGGAALGLGVAFYAWMEATVRTNTVLAAYASGMAGAAIIGLAIVVVPIVSLVVFFFGRAYGSRRLMAFRMEREVAAAEREAAASGMTSRADDRAPSDGPDLRS